MAIQPFAGVCCISLTNEVFISFDANKKPHFNSFVKRNLRMKILSDFDVVLD